MLLHLVVVSCGLEPRDGVLCILDFEIYHCRIVNQNDVNFVVEGVLGR